MKNNFEVLILCGGEGKRLRSLVSNVPKPMAPIGKVPFLDYLVKVIAEQGFINFCFLTGYKADKISEYFSNNFKNLNIRFSEEDVPLGTGGGVFQAIRSSKFNKFLVFNGDTFFNIDLNEFIKEPLPPTVKMALKQTSDHSRYGQVKLDKNGKVVSFVEKGFSSSADGYINAGIYLLDKNILSYGPANEKFISLENDIFPRILNSPGIYGQTFAGDFIDIGIPEDYISAQYLIQKWTQGKSAK